MDICAPHAACLDLHHGDTRRGKSGAVQACVSTLQIPIARRFRERNERPDHTAKSGKDLNAEDTARRSRTK